VSKDLAVLLAHPGTQYSSHLARELSRRGMLDAFYTSLAINAESALARGLSPLARMVGRESVWQNRLLYGVPAAKVHCYPGLEVSSFWHTRRRESPISVYRRRNDRFQLKIPYEALAAAQAVIGFDTSSHILARRAILIGRRFFLDRSIAYEGGVNGLFATLRERFPDWSETVPHKSAADLEIEEREHSLANVIVVPSKFVAQTLINSGVPAGKIRVNPFGTDLERFSVRPATNSDGPLVFLFVGALSARKGLPLLLQAWDRLQPRRAELWIVGGGLVPSRVRRDSQNSIRWLGPVSREKLPGVFQQADVFVFPSYFEGLAQVQIEAAACGLPVIGTSASGAEEIIEEGETGYLIEPGNLEQLVERLREFLARPALAQEMGEQVKKKRSALSWSLYGDRWSQILRDAN
jgi:glycosyltransferase involved in cell wall biosynthesis